MSAAETATHEIDDGPTDRPLRVHVTAVVARHDDRRLVHLIAWRLVRKLRDRRQRQLPQLCLRPPLVLRAVRGGGRQACRGGRGRDGGEERPHRRIAACSRRRRRRRLPPATPSLPRTADRSSAIAPPPTCYRATQPDAMRCLGGRRRGPALGRRAPEMWSTAWERQRIDRTCTNCCRSAERRPQHRTAPAPSTWPRGADAMRWPAGGRAYQGGRALAGMGGSTSYRVQ